MYRFISCLSSFIYISVFLYFGLLNGYAKRTSFKHGQKISKLRTISTTQVTARDDRKIVKLNRVSFFGR